METRDIIGWFLTVSGFILASLGGIFFNIPNQFSTTLSSSLLGVGSVLAIIGFLIIRGFIGDLWGGLGDIASGVGTGVKLGAQGIGTGVKYGAQGLATGVKYGAQGLATGAETGFKASVGNLFNNAYVFAGIGLVLLIGLLIGGLGYFGVDLGISGDTFTVVTNIIKVLIAILCVVAIIFAMYLQSNGSSGMNMYAIAAFIILLTIVATYFLPQLGSMNVILYAFFGLIGVFLVVYTTLNYDKKQGSVKVGVSPTTFFKLIYYFLPYGVLMFTTLADLLNLKFKYSAATLTGIITVILNALVTRFFTSPRDTSKINPVSGKAPSIPVVDTNYCGIPGFGWMGSNIFPQAMLFNLTTLAHLGVQIGYETNFDPKHLGSSGGLFAGVFILSTAMNILNDCFKDNKFVWQKIVSDNRELGIFLTVLSTAVISGGAGALGGWITSFTLKEGFAGYVQPDKPKTEEPDICKGDKCSADESGQFVAEIYQNGKIIGTSAQ